MVLKIFLSSLFNNQILYDELSLLEEEVSLKDQTMLLKEDLLQVESIDGSYLLDVGWYQEFDITGHFEVKIIKKYDWENPIFIKKTSDISSLKKILLKCKSMLDSKSL